MLVLLACYSGGISAVADEANHFSPRWQVGKCNRGCFAIIVGLVGLFRGRGRSLRGDKGDRGGFSTVADDVYFRGRGEG